MDKKKNLGKLGELIAFYYLEKRSYIILEKNWKFKHLEVDIIASFKGELVFFEIKTNLNFLFPPEENLKRKQVKNLKKAMQCYCRLNFFDVENCRLDLIVINLNNHLKLKKMFHYKNIIF